MQILELLLASDNGATAQYIQSQELVRLLLWKLCPLQSQLSFTGNVVDLHIDQAEL